MTNDKILWAYASIRNAVAMVDGSVAIETPILASCIEPILARAKRLLWEAMDDEDHDKLLAAYPTGNSSQ